MIKTKVLLTPILLALLFASCKEIDLRSKSEQIDYLNGRVLYNENVVSEDWGIYKRAHGLAAGNLDTEAVFEFDGNGNFNYTTTASDCAYLNEDGRKIVDKVITDFSVNYTEITSISEVTEYKDAGFYRFIIQLREGVGLRSSPESNPFGDIPFLTNCDENRDETQYETERLSAPLLPVTSVSLEELEAFRVQFQKLIQK